MIPYSIGTKFATEVPARQGSLHTKFEENRSRQFRDTSNHNFILITSCCTLCKICHKTQMHAPIGLNVCSLKGLITADLSAKFGRNQLNIHRVMTNYSHKIRLKVCHTYRVNPLKEWVENCYVDGITITEVTFCGLNESR